jgi:hypothetical protein
VLIKLMPEIRPSLRPVRAACLVLLVLLACAAVAQAVPLSTYRERVHQASILLDSLQAGEEDTHDPTRPERIQATLAEVRRLLPPSETVEWDNTSMQVDNAWLGTALQHYEELSRAPAAQRAARSRK